MDLEKVVRLVRLLTERTMANEMKWNSDSSNYYTSSVGKQKIAVFERYPEVDHDFIEPDYILAIIKDSGEWIDSFSDTELKSVMSDSFRVMGDLYKAAKRSANGIPNIIDQMIDRLEPF